MTYLKVRFALLTLAENYSKITGKADTEDCDLAEIFKDLHDFNCM